MPDVHHGWSWSYKPQFLGLVLSFLLTVAAYRFVTHHVLSDFLLYLTIFGCGLTQVLIQFVLFFHLGLEDKPHWNTITFLFTLLVITIVVGGTFWIMNNLNYDLMPTMPTMGH